MASSPQTIVNPLTPLAYLYPSSALQQQASQYLYVGTLGAFVWDWLMSMHEEYKMIKVSRNHLGPVVVYFISRLGAFGYIMGSVLFQASPIANCEGLLIAIGICAVLAMPTTSFLFCIRVWAIFYNNPMVRALFAFLWLSILGTSITVPFAVTGKHIGPTQYCINSGVQSFASSVIITTAVNDTLVLIAISYKLSRNNNVNSTWREMATSFFNFGDGFNAVSRTLFQGGLIYYLTTISMNILTMVVVLTPSAPPVYRAMVALPNIGLQNVMACRVFRKLKLGIIGKGEVESQQSWPLSWRRHTIGSVEASRSRVGVKPRSSDLDDGSGSSVMNIKVTRDVEFMMDSGSTRGTKFS